MSLYVCAFDTCYIGMEFVLDQEIKIKKSKNLYCFQIFICKA